MTPATPTCMDQFHNLLMEWDIYMDRTHYIVFRGHSKAESGHDLANNLIGFGQDECDVLMFSPHGMPQLAAMVDTSVETTQWFRGLDDDMQISVRTAQSLLATAENTQTVSYDLGPVLQLYYKVFEEEMRRWCYRHTELLNRSAEEQRRMTGKSPKRGRMQYAQCRDLLEELASTSVLPAEQDGVLRSSIPLFEALKSYCSFRNQYVHNSVANSSDSQSVIFIKTTVLCIQGVLNVVVSLKRLDKRSS